MKRSTKTTHQIYVLDTSGSMGMHMEALKRFYAAQLTADADSALDLKVGDVTVSAISFGSSIAWHERRSTPIDALARVTLIPFWGNMTALLDAITEACVSATSLVKGKPRSTSAVITILTDGEENASSYEKRDAFKTLVKTILRKKNITLAAFVPDTRGYAALARWGFPEGNIKVWEVSQKGFEVATETAVAAKSQFYAARSTGVRSSTSYFVLDPTFLVKDAKASGAKILVKSSYQLHVVRDPKTTDKKRQISDVVEGITRKSYVIGSTYYLLSKPEKIQAFKKLIVVDNNSGKAYHGDGVRDLLGLPAHEVKVKPTDFSRWNIYVQSTSTNRNLYPGSSILIVKDSL